MEKKFLINTLIYGGRTVQKVASGREWDMSPVLLT